MLQRYSQVGEHYIMRVPDGAFKEDKSMIPGAADILIYDEERDVHVKITFKAALKASGIDEILEENKNVDIWLADAKGNKRMTLSAFKAAADDIAAGNAASDTDNVMDVAICVARPFIEHAMLSAVLTVSGQDTGATIFGPSDMQASNDHRSREFHQSVVGAYLLTDPRRPLVHRCRPTRRSRRSRAITRATSSR
jgi:hypothetical protein